MERIVEVLLSGAVGALLVWVLQFSTERRRRRYERRLYILRSLIANSANIVSVDFVSAFNMILIEYNSKSVVREWHGKFMEHVTQRPASDEEEAKIRNKKFESILIKLIEEIAKSIHIRIEQLDLADKIYWPRGFADVAEKQQKLTDLLIDNHGYWNNLLEQAVNQDRQILLETKKIPETANKRKKDANE